MRLSIITYVIILMTMAFSSCSVDEDPKEILAISGLQSANLVTRANEESLLSFDNKEEFLKAQQEIAALPSSEDKENWVKEMYPEFTSIQNLYWRAMEEMAQIDDVTEERYAQFEQKYAG